MFLHLCSATRRWGRTLTGLGFMLEALGLGSAVIIRLGFGVVGSTLDLLKV